MLDPAILRVRLLRSGLTAFFFQYLLQAGLFFAVPLFLSIALGLSAIETGVRILPLSITLIIAAVGIPKVFPKASPRRVCQFGFFALFLGLVVFVAALDAGAGAEIVTWPMLLAGAGIGALASQLGAVTVSALPDEQSGEVGGLQNTFSNLGLSIGTALAGAVLMSALTASFFAGIQSNPDVPNDLSSKAQTELTSGVPFISDADLEQALDDAGVSQKTTDAVVAENAEARLDALRASLVGPRGARPRRAVPQRQHPHDAGRRRTGRRRSRHLVPAGAGAALAFVHGLHARDGDRAALLDERVAQALRRGHPRRPLVDAVELPQRGVHGEVAGRDAIEIVPGHGERHRHARSHPRAVRRDHRRAADTGRVDEHLAPAILLDERGRREVGIEPLGAGRDRARRGGRVLERCVIVDRHEHVHSLRPAGLDRTLQPDIGQRPAHEVRDPHRHRERIGIGWVEVEHEMRHAIGTVDPHERGVVLDRALVREPQQACGGRCTARTTPPASTSPPTSAPWAPTAACTSGRSSA